MTTPKAQNTKSKTGKPSPAWSPAKAIKLRAKGWTYAAISRHFNVSVTVVRNAVDPMPPRPADRGPFDVEAAAESYRSGKTLRQISIDTGYSRQYVHTHLKAAGVQMRPMTAPRASRVSDAKREAILAGWEAGQTQERIATEVGASTETIRKVLVAAGIDPASRRHRIDRERARELRLQGWTLPQIAAEVGTSPQYVWHLTNDLEGIPDWRDRSRISEREVVAMYEGGATIAQIADHFKVGRYAVRAALENTSVRLRVGGPRRVRLDMDRVRRLRAEGLSVQKIAEQMGCSHATVSKRLRGMVPNPERPHQVQFVSLATERAVTRAWNSGKTISWIRRELHVSYWTVMRVVRKLGDDPTRALRRPRGPRPQARQLDRQRMVRLRAAGWTLGAIARDQGTTAAYASQVLRQEQWRAQVAGVAEAAVAS
ncbi:helix-turn-helix domain-containing protein [Planomonospora sp. ID82291]|uniref:helix-turn-helix domain-containing protein n=1 Tax=Planomonospora sp. ID82291 TaxID=2738136 RepID=UPI0018C37CF0|nr:helix-turn-helix domain-containing protein [Planomonospora sp. ID82291]MBG0818756.1 helix-turn-helix domain-containing protein [Planomonospora sp. ID82291]